MKFKSIIEGISSKLLEQDLGNDFELIQHRLGNTTVPAVRDNTNGDIYYRSMARGPGEIMILSPNGQVRTRFLSSFGPLTTQAIQQAGILNRDATVQSEQQIGESKSINENLADLAHKAEMDHEVQMARADLYKLAKYSIKLHEILKGISEAEGLEGWQQAKITKAADYISSVYHSLEYDVASQAMPESKKGPDDYKLSLAEKVQKKLSEKAVSQNQQQAAGIALKHKREGTRPQAGTASASMMSMSVAELEKIARTKHQGLPDTVASEGERHGNDSMYDKCWDGYERVPGTTRGEKGSCRKK